MAWELKLVWSGCSQDMSVYLEYLMVRIFRGIVVVWHGAKKMDKLTSSPVVGSGWGPCPPWPSLVCKFGTVIFNLKVTRILPSLLTWSWRSTADLPCVVVICPHSSDDWNGFPEAAWEMGDAHVSQTALLKMWDLLDRLDGEVLGKGTKPG